MASALIPVNISFNLKGKEIDITDYAIEVSFENGCYYHESVSGKKGSKEQALHQGSEIVPSGDMSVFVKKTPDKKLDKSVDALRKASDDKKDKDPKKYAHPILFCFSDFTKKIFAKVGFTGYIRDMKTASDESAEAGCPVYEAEIEIFDTSSLYVKN